MKIFFESAGNNRCVIVNYKFHLLNILDQIVPSIGSSLNGSPRSDLDFGIERFSRKVFVGGLPPDIDEGKEFQFLFVISFCF